MRFDRSEEAKQLNGNLFEVRVTLRWPVLGDNQIGRNRQTFRALVGGVQTNKGGYYFFQPQSYVLN